MTEESQDKSPEETIEDLYQQAVAGISQTPVETPAQATQTPQPTEQLPDALKDSDGHAKALNQQFNALRQEIAEERQAREKQASDLREQEDNRDFREAVDRLASKVKVPPHQRELVEGYLMAKAVNSKALSGLWQARGQNPTAFKQAIDALAQPLMDALAAKEEPQIAENQRALDDAMRSQTTSSATPAAETPDERIMKMGKGEFDAEWRKLKGDVW